MRRILIGPSSAVFSVTRRGLRYVDVDLDGVDAALVAVCQLDFQAYGPRIFSRVLQAFREELIGPHRPLGETSLMEDLRLVASPDLIAAYRDRPVRELAEDLVEEAARNPDYPVRLSQLFERQTNIIAYL